MKRRSKARPQPLGGGLRLRRRLRIVDLRQIDDTLVSAEIIVAQFGIAVEAKAADHQRIEMTDEEVGEVERAGLLLGERSENGFSPA